MPDERKPVICPWCVGEMQRNERQDIFNGVHYFFECTSKEQL